MSRVHFPPEGERAFSFATEAGIGVHCLVAILMANFHDSPRADMDRSRQRCACGDTGEPGRLC